jgi:hypothetical protein
MATDPDDDDDDDNDDSDTEEFCDIDVCNAPAAETVVVSVNSPGDETRNFCYGCYQAYMIGVQHGRFHEAARHGTVPGLDSSQDPPEPLQKEEPA